MMKHPPVPGLVSVNMPFFNVPEPFLREAVESVYDQTYGNWELILIDDGSEPSLSAVAKALAARRPDKIRYIEHEEHRNLGISASRNRALAISRGEFVAFLDADDTWDETQLEEQVELLGSQPEVGMLYGSTICWRSWSRRAGKFGRDSLYRLRVRVPQVVEPPVLLDRILRGRAVTPCMTSVIVRRQIIDDGVCFEEDFREHYEDQVFLAKVFANYRVYVADACWGKYRQHPGSLTAAGDNSSRARTWRLRYLHWLDAYLSEQDVKDSRVRRAVRREIWTSNHPVVGRIYRAMARRLWILFRKLRHA
jgi:glycosyltransferase involved in cell wall biosynthesis